MRDLATPQFLGELLRGVLEQALGTFALNRSGSEPIAQDDSVARPRPMTDVDSEPQGPATNALGEEGLEDIYINPTIPDGAYSQENGVDPMMEWQSAGADDVGHPSWTQLEEVEQESGMSTTRTRQRHNTPNFESTEYGTLVNVDTFMGSIDFSGQDFEQFTSMLEQLIETATYPDSAYYSAPSGTQTPDDKRKDECKSTEKGLGDASV